MLLRAVSSGHYKRRHDEHVPRGNSAGTLAGCFRCADERAANAQGLRTALQILSTSVERISPMGLDFHR